VTELAETLARCLKTQDREGVVTAILSAVDFGLSIEDLYTRVLEPFLVSVGAEWQEGRTAVWEEHLIVTAVRSAVEALYPAVLARKARVRPVPVTVAFFCPPEENHDLGLRMLADRFDLRGFHTVFVGAMTPTAQMVECARRVGAAVVCLSASTHFQRTALSTVVKTLRAGLPGVRIVVGGAAFARSACGWEEYIPGSVDALLDELVAGATGSSGVVQAAGTEEADA
jgi:methanogenic corrinoid protein MtbC1